VRDFTVEYGDLDLEVDILRKGSKNKFDYKNLKDGKLITQK